MNSPSNCFTVCVFIKWGVDRIPVLEWQWLPRLDFDDKEQNYLNSINRQRVDSHQLFCGVVLPVPLMEPFQMTEMDMALPTGSARCTFHSGAIMLD